MIVPPLLVDPSVQVGSSRGVKLIELPEPVVGRKAYHRTETNSFNENPITYTQAPVVDKLLYAAPVPADVPLAVDKTGINAGMLANAGLKVTLIVV